MANQRKRRPPCWVVPAGPLDIAAPTGRGRDSGGTGAGVWFKLLRTMQRFTGCGPGRGLSLIGI